jgi:hypothetical protein
MLAISLPTMSRLNLEFENKKCISNEYTCIYYIDKLEWKNLIEGSLCFIAQETRNYL